MTTSEQLIEEAEEQDIEIIYTHLNENGSCSATYMGQEYIGLDTARCSEALQRVRIAHETGHCVLGAFYNMYAPLDSRRKHEIHADVYAIERLIPLPEFRLALAAGNTEMWEIAEVFDVTCEFAEKAMIYYRDKV